MCNIKVASQITLFSPKKSNSQIALKRNKLQSLIEFSLETSLESRYSLTIKECLSLSSEKGKKRFKSVQTMVNVQQKTFKICRSRMMNNFVCKHPKYTKK